MKQIDVLKSIVETSLAGKFIYANIYEANADIDKIKDEDFPIYIHLAALPMAVEDTESGAPNRTLSMLGFWLTKIEMVNIDYKTVDIQPTIDIMTKTAEKMIALLCLDPISNSVQGNGIKKWKITPTYAKFDAGIFGVAIEFKWTTNDGLRICTQ